MTRLKPGELQAMPEEERRAHLREQKKAWRHQHPEFIKRQNRKWGEFYRKTKPCVCVCHKCGEDFNACRKYFVTCPACVKKRFDEAKRKKMAEIARRERKLSRNEQILLLHSKGLLQHEISACVGIGQAAVSYVLRKHGIRSDGLHKR